MNYEQRLVEGAKYVYAGYSSTSADARVDLSELEIKATLKHHQVEDVSWLIRRYHLGVNVILDGTWEDFTSYISFELSESMPEVSWAIPVTDNWVSEVANFAPNLRLLRYVGEKEHRRKLRWEMYEYIKTVIILWCSIMVI